MLQKMQLVRSVGITAALALTVVVSGCGGKGGNKNYAPEAVFQFGQPNYQNTTANRGVFVVTGNSLNNPSGAATNGTKFYIADQGNNRILGFNSLPTKNTTTADFVIGQPNLTSNTPGNGVGQLSSPTKVAISPDGQNLLIVDNANSRVLIWYGTLPVNNSTPPTVTLGDGLSAVSATNLSTPYGATFAPSATYPKRVIVADTGNNRVLVYNDPTASTAANYVLGQRDLVPGSKMNAAGNMATWTGNSPNCPQLTGTITTSCDISLGQVGADTLYTPGDVWSDGAKLIIADTGNGRVLYFPTVPTQLAAGTYTTGNTGGPATFVLGQNNMITRTTSGGGQSGFTQPSTVWRDLNSGNIFVGDSGNNRVLAFRTPTSGNGLPAVSVYGQGDFSHVTANDDDQNNVADTDNGIPQASDRTLFAPAGATTSAGLVYVPDSGNNRLMVFTIQ